jgi:hypothetical protein
VRAVAVVVVAMILGIAPYGAWSMYQRVYYAYEDARGMFPVQVVMALVVIVGTLGSRFVLPARYWVAGAGFSMSVSYLVGALWSAWYLRRWIHHVDGPRVVRLHVKAAVAALLAALVGLGVVAVIDRAMPTLTHVRSLLQCVVGGVLMSALYVGALRVMSVREIDALLEPVVRRMPRAARLAAPSSMSPTSAQVREVAVTDVARGTLLAGRYRVVDPLTSDLPTASLWSAADQILDRHVRVRILPSGSAVALDAARRAALVTDPRLVRVLDVGTEQGHGYVVGEHVAGTSLEELLARGPLTADQARAVVGEAAAALEVARRRGVHHLALRPSAVHLGDDGRVIVSGLALDAAVLGIPGGDARTTSRADAVGLVRLLYAALTGHWPADPDGATLSALPPAPRLDGAPIPPAELVGDVPNDLDTLCVVTLGPHEDGPHTPGELVRDLEPWGEIRRVSGPDARGNGRAGGVGDYFGGAAAAAAAGFGAAAGAAAGRPAAAGAAPDTRGVDASARSFSAGSEGDADTAPDVAAPWPAGLGTGAGAPGTGAAAPTPAAAPAWPAGLGTGAAPAGPGGAARDDQSRPTGPVYGAGAIGGAAGAAAVGAAAQGPTGPRADANVEDDLSDTLPVQVHRQSVRTAFETPGTGTNRPGTPPPAAPVRTSAFSASTLPSFPPRDVPEQPLPPADSPFAFEEVEQTERRRFNPTGLVLAIVVIAVVVGVVFAAKALFASIEGHTSGSAHTAVSTPTGQSPSPTAGGNQTQAAPPVIASASTYDPSDPAGEHSELAAQAIDGNPATAWYTRTYKNSHFAGLKDGVALIIQLQQPALVSQVTITSASQGGNIQIRPVDPQNPAGGEPLASGPMTGTTTFKLTQPTQLSSVVIWVSELPTSADKIRLEVNEVAIS